MKNFSKALVGTVAAGAMALSSASPAVAQGRDHNDRDGVSAGDIIAGALIIGGIAAVASAGSRDRGYDGDYRYDRAGYGDRYEDGRGYGRDGRDGYGGNPRQAVEQCVRAAEREASRRYGRADVTDVRDIDRKRWGFEVKGRIAVRGNDRDWRRGDARYGSGWGGEEHRGYDSGSFKCKFERGRVVDVDFGGIRGL
jgi:hypothetical protein